MASAVTLVGDGMDATVIHHTGASNAINITSSVAKANVRDLSLYGDNNASLIGLNISTGTRGHYANLRIRNFLTGLSVENCWNASFYQVTTDQNRQDGVYLGVEANNLGMYNCISTENVRAGFYVHGAHSVSLVECDYETNDYGLFITADDGHTTEKISVVGGYFEQNATEDVRITRTSGSTRPKALSILDGYFINDGGPGGGAGMAIRVMEVNGLLLDGNHFSARGTGYLYSLYLTDYGVSTRVIWGSGNYDESGTGGPFKGIGMSYITTDETTH